MSLNKSELPVPVIAGLYKTSLISGEQIKKTTIPTDSGKDQGIQFLGENNKGICILVKYKNEVYLPDLELNFLVSILQACKLNLGDVAIINCYQQPISFEDLRKQTQCNFLLVFGMSGPDVGLKSITEFIIKKINNCSIVISPAVEELNDNSTEAKLLKSKLWLCLKQLFNV